MTVPPNTPFPSSTTRSAVETDALLKRLNITWPKNVTELHVHLGGSVPLYRLWEIAIDRGIRGIGSGYEDFINILKIQDGKVKDLDSYLEVYDKIELIQSGPASVRESIIIAVHRAYRTGGMVKVGPGGEGAHLKASLRFDASNCAGTPSRELVQYSSRGAMRVSTTWTALLSLR